MTANSCAAHMRREWRHRIASAGDEVGTFPLPSGELVPCRTDRSEWVTAPDPELVETAPGG
jgi:hypothetical protein